MPRTKEKKEIHHKSSTHEIILSLEAMPKWVDILLKNSDKEYCHFIKWYVNNHFFIERNEKIVIKELSKRYGLAESSKITKWLNEAYNDIFILNIEKPELFNIGERIRQEYTVKYYDDRVYMNMWLPLVPRIYEEVRMPFLKGKYGIDFFWVSKVSYKIVDNEIVPDIWLKGGLPNPYREMLLYRAEFERWIDYSDSYFKHDYEIDEGLRKLYTR